MGRWVRVVTIQMRHKIQQPTIVIITRLWSLLRHKEDVETIEVAFVKVNKFTNRVVQNKENPAICQWVDKLQQKTLRPEIYRKWVFVLVEGKKFMWCGYIETGSCGDNRWQDWIQSWRMGYRIVGWEHTNYRWFGK